jgi:sugar O-acyltransferase (sialic acid O-acetyltransferase NeuD family)
MEKVLFLGSSGHASVILDALNLGGQFFAIGCLDDTVPPGTVRSGLPILGAFRDLESVCARYACKHVVVAVGDNWQRRKICSELISQDIDCPVVKHPSAIVASSASIGRGSVIFANSHVGINAKVGDFCIVNTGSSIDHDGALSNYSSIAPGVFMGGLVEIGECSHIGVGASISDRIKIGRHAVIGTGSVVVQNMPDFALAYGNPAKIKRLRNEGEEFLGDRQTG